MAETANLGITNKASQKVALELNKILSDEFVLYTKTLNFHWNVEGANFYSLHILFEKQYNQMSKMIDELAERIRKIGHYANGTLGDFLKLTNLVENSVEELNSKTMVDILLDDHEVMTRKLRAAADAIEEKQNDKGSADLLTNFIQQHETMAWMLRATTAK